MKKVEKQSFQNVVVRVARVHFLLIGVYALYIALSDAWKLITPQVVLQRWIAVGSILVVTTAIWYIAKSYHNKTSFNKLLLFVFIVQDLLFASFNVYSTRGMASRAVILFLMPIITSAFFGTRVALYATATFSTAFYTMSAIKYYFDFPGEGYRIELYAELAFFSAIFFVFAALLSALVRSRD